VASNPFPGLRPFQPDEEHLFFGREGEIDDLLRRLRSTRFLAVVGASGSGKSSLVRSGLIPSLQGGFMAGTGSGWRVAMMRPGENPIGHLAAALDAPDVMGVEGEMASTHRVLLEATLGRSSLGLANAVRQARLPAGENILVVVDQFEELFRFRRSRPIAGSRDEAVAFVKLLLDASRQQDVPVYVVLTMRSDFIGDCVEFPGLAEAVNTGMFLVGRMSRDSLRSAIQGPVAVGGGRVSPRLVHRVLNDLGDDQDQLPLVQHALMRSWDHWEGRRGSDPDSVLDVEDYEAIGTLQGALSLHAEEAYAELESMELHSLTEQVFRALTDTFSDPRGVRRPTSVEELALITGGSQASVCRVVEVFRRPGRAFLMPPPEVPLTPGSIVDLSHESLMRCWTRLIAWAEEEKAAASFYARISQAARWHAEGVAGLWGTPEIELAGRWRRETRPTAAWAARYDDGFERSMAFLEASQREMEASLARDERERKARLRRTQGAVAVLAVFLVVATSLALVAWQERSRATANLALARAAVDESLFSSEPGATGSATDVPELEEFRRELLQKAQAFYSEFLNQESRSERARHDMANAHFRLGHINRLVHRPDEAVAEYTRAIGRFEELARQYPRNPGYRQTLAEAHNWMGETLRPLAGRSDEAAVAYDRALELQRALVAGAPDRREPRSDLARTLYNRGILRWSLGDASGAEADFREAVTLLEPLATGSPLAAQGLSRALNNLAGVMAMDEGRTAGAISLFRQAVTLHEGLVADDPENREFRLELAKFSNNLAGVLLDRQDAREAERYSARAIELIEGMARLPPGISVERADARTLRGMILQGLSPADALDEFRRAVDYFEAIHDDPAVHRLPEFHWRFGDLLGSLAAFRGMSAGSEEAGELLSRAVGLYAAVASEVARSGSPATVQEARDTVARVLPDLPSADQGVMRIAQEGLR